MQYQWIPAKVGDVIKKMSSYYASDLADGEHFVVLDVFSGDDTAVVLGRDGKLKTLSYPEEYEVAGVAQNLVDEMYDRMDENHRELKKRIAERKKDEAYIDTFEWLGIKLDE